MTTTTPNETHPGNIILEQLGGLNRLTAMIGARLATLIDNGVQFRLEAHANDRINSIRITLDPSDTYTVQFWRIARRGLEFKLVDEFALVYADNLRDTIERRTGLALSL